MKTQNGRNQPNMPMIIKPIIKDLLEEIAQKSEHIWENEQKTVQKRAKTKLMRSYP